MLFILLDAREPVFWIISLPWCSVLSSGLNPIYHDYARCIHCGLCPEYCPTYRLWNLEADSPCGRIHQIIHVEQNDFRVTDSFVDYLDNCFDCRASVNLCPSAVEYAKLAEHVRVESKRTTS